MMLDQHTAHAVSSSELLAGILQRAIEAAGGVRALGRKLDWDPATISRAAAGSERLSAYRASQLATVTGANEVAAIYAALEHIARTEAESAHWRNQFREVLIGSGRADVPAGSDANLLQEIVDGFALPNEEHLAALLSMELERVSAIRRGAKMTGIEKIKAWDRVLAIKTRHGIESVLPDSLAKKLANWVQHQVLADAKKAISRQAARS